MTELLENSDNTNESAVVSESPANEATISLAAVQALADALQKIEAYTPTVWVDNESPDIDAAHLNKAEQAIMRVTTAMNSAVDVIKDLQSQLNTTNNNLTASAYSFTAADGKTIVENHSFKVGDLIIVSAKLKVTATGEDLLSFTDTAKNKGTVFVIGKGTEWAIASAIYGYIGDHWISTQSVDISVGDYVHVHGVIVL